MVNIEFNSVSEIRLSTHHIKGVNSFCSNELRFKSKYFGYDELTVVSLYTEPDEALVCYIDRKIGLDGVE